MSLDPRTPILVGAGVVQQRFDDPADAKEVLELMHEALDRAADDAGARELLERAGSIRAPRGFWSYPDPCRELARRFGAEGAHTLVAEVGVLQTTLFGGAARDIADGRFDIVLVTGAEAKFRSLRAQILGVEAPESVLPNTAEADEVLRPHAEIMDELELALDLAMPVRQYSMIDQALGHLMGQGVEERRDAIAKVWAGMSEVAAGNPDAWRREAVTPEFLREPSAKNPMLAFPYTKLHNSQWNVDQAAGLIFCSVAVAEELGIPRERWIFPHAVAESNHMVPLAQRAEPGRCPGFRQAGKRALSSAGWASGDIAHMELYSCFPAAVRMQAFEMELDLRAPPTVTGGMAFAGGPLNNFVLQALARMAAVLRAEPGSRGMVNAVSGFLTKQGVSLWSTEAPRDGFGYFDVSDETKSELATVEVDKDLSGPVTVRAYTVLHEGELLRGAALCDGEGGKRTIAITRDPVLCERMEREEMCGRAATVREGELSF